MRRLTLAAILLSGCTVNQAEFAGRLPPSDASGDRSGDVGPADALTDAAGDDAAAAPDDGGADASPDVCTSCGDAAGDLGPQADAPPQTDTSVQDDAAPQTDVLPQTDTSVQDDAAPQTDVLPQTDGPYSTAGWHDLTPGSLPPSWPAARGQHGLVYDRARHVAVLFGGVNNSTAFNDTWEWDGAVWALCNNSPPPNGPGNCNPVMVYDAARGVSVTFGCGVGDELWEWNGTAWNNRTPTPRPALWPGVRTCCAAASYDSARGRTVLFGGWRTSPNTYYQDTWEWDGTAWTHAADGPTTLTSHAMAYDEERAVSLVHSGGNGTTWRLTQMLEWSGTTWTTRDPVGSPPPGRAQATMVYESRRQLAVLFAGYNTTPAALADTWEYDGLTRSWTDRGAFTGPHVRAQHAAVFNPDRGTMLVFGGSYYVTPNTFYLGDLWEYQGP